MFSKIWIMDNLDILGVGNALVDETFYIEEDLVRKTNLNFNQFKQISYSEQQEIKSLLGNQDPEIVCGGSTTNSLVAASNFGSKCGHICQLGRDSLGDLYEHNLKENNIEVIKSTEKGGVIDTTGAGDIYAGGFIHGLINNYSLKKCGELGSICAGHIITQLGSRSDIDFRELI